MKVAPERIKLLSCVGVEFDGSLLPFFARHYLDLGIPPENFAVILNAPSRTSAALEQAVRDLEEHDIEPAEIWIGPYTSGTMWEKRRSLQDRFVGPDDWVVSADVDELHEYPAPLDRFLGECEARGINAVQGPFVDRVAPDGQLAAVDLDNSLWDQFPLEADVICSVGGSGEHYGRMGTVKMMAFRPPLQPSKGGHRLIEDRGPIRYYLGTNIGRLHCITDPSFRFLLPVRVHHFKWTATLLDSIESRLQTPGVSVAGSEYGRKILTYCRDQGRVRLTDVALREDHVPEHGSRPWQTWRFRILREKLTRPVRRMVARGKRAVRAVLRRLPRKQVDAEA